MSEGTDNNHWHLDRKLNVAYLSVMLTLSGSIIVWAMTIETRIAEQAVKIESVSSQVERVEQRSSDSMRSLTDVVMRIDDKLDRLIERK